MKSNEELERERNHRKQEGTKYPFTLMYLFLCSPCRQEVLNSSTDLPEELAVFLTKVKDLFHHGPCERFCHNAILNIGRNISRSTCPAKPQIIEHEILLDRLVGRCKIKAGLSKESVNAYLDHKYIERNEIATVVSTTHSPLGDSELEHLSFRDNPLWRDSLEQHINKSGLSRLAKRFRSAHFNQRRDRWRINDVPRLSSALAYTETPIPKTPDWRYYITPYGWSYSELKLNAHPK